VKQAVLGDRLLDTGMFNQASLRQLVEQHQSGVRDHSAPLWSLLMFDAFIGQAVPAETESRRLSA